MLFEEADTQIAKLKDQEAYVSYQEELGFTKELAILRNDFYYKMTAVSDTSVSLIELLIPTT